MAPGELGDVPVTVFSAAHPPSSRKRPYIERALQVCMGDEWMAIWVHEWVSGCFFFFGGGMSE